MKLFTKRLLSILMVLCLTLMTLGVAVKVNAATIEKKTVSEMLALAPSTTFYQMKGKITKIVNPTYGNIDFTDETGTIFFYGLTKTQVSKNDKSFGSLNLKVGDEIIVNGQRSEHAGKPQIKGAYFVQKVELTGTPFEKLDTKASLNVDYIHTITQEQGNKEVSEDYEIAVKDSGKHDVPVGTITNGNASLAFVNNGNGVNCRFWTPKSKITELRLYVDHTLTVTFGDYDKIAFICSNGASKLATICSSSVENYNKVIIKAPTSKVSTFTINQKDIIITNILFIKNVLGTVDVHNYSITQENSMNKIGLRFGGIVDKTLYDTLVASGTNVTFGVAYAKTSELNGKTFDAALTDKTAHFIDCNPALVDETGKESATGTNYQFAVVLNHIPNTSFNDEVSAACYVCVDGNYQLMQTSTYSVNTLAKNYVDTQATNPAVAPHVEMLKWLSKVTA